MPNQLCNHLKIHTLLTKKIPTGALAKNYVIVSESVTISWKRKEKPIAPDKFCFVHGSTNGERLTPLNRTPYLSGPRRYFFHHSYRVLSLQNYPPLAGKTDGTRIDKYCTLIMPLVRKCKEQHALAHLYKPSCSALICSPPLRLEVPSFKLLISFMSFP